MTRPALIPIALALALLAPAAAQARNVDVPAAFGSSLGKLSAKSAAPIYLPGKIDLDIDAATKVFAEGSAGKKGYGLTLAGAKSCGANACFFAFFSGERGQPIGFRTNTTLIRGIQAHYQPLSCGGSCSPPWIAWKLAGVRYEIQAKVPHAGKAYFVKLANAAIRAGGR